MNATPPKRGPRRVPAREARGHGQHLHLHLHLRLRLRKLAGVLLVPMLLSCGGGGDGDTAPPPPQWISLDAPANLADGLAGTITLAATARAGTGVVAVEFQLDGASAAAEDASAPFAVNIDTARWASGQHVVRARGRDAAGNRSAWAAATVRFGGSRGVPAGFTKNDNWVGGLNAATAIAAAPDGRLFVTEQGGNLRVVKNGALLATPFHTLAVDTEGERGLIGVALHPNFASNGFVYVYHTRINGAARNNRITRLAARTPSSDVSNGAEAALVDLPNLSAAANHNGGALKFGIDGKLFVGVGDNANGTKAQNRADPFGKVLRFNEDGTPASDNPFFASQSGLARAVWAYGLRNPYTLAVQPGSGRLHINDVGEETWEEINLGAAGANYGWPGSEGPDNITSGVSAPLFTYRHADPTPVGSGLGGFLVGQAITGGAFYPATGPFPAPYRGNYFFADFLGGFIGMLDLVNGNAAYTFGSVAGLPVDMVVGSDGALYVLTRGSIVRFAAL